MKAFAKSTILLIGIVLGVLLWFFKAGIHLIGVGVGMGQRTAAIKMSEHAKAKEAEATS